MNGVRPGAARRFNESIDVQIRITGWRRADGHCLIRETHMQRITVKLGINRNRLNAHSAARAHNAHSNLPAISNENFADIHYH
jgi:hypothetical protein